MVIQRFEDIIARQKARDFAVEIYGVFSSVNDFVFKKQICGAVLSISNNIAEGFDRRTDAGFSRFLYIAISSCSEVKSTLYLTGRLNYLSAEIKTHLIENASEVARIIRGLIKSLAPKK